MEIMREVIREDLLQSFIGKEFVSYKHDPIHFTNSVYEIVGLIIGNKKYALTNKIEDKEYYSELDQISVLRLNETENIVSSLENISQIEIPVHSVITSIKLINEHQIVFKEDKVDFDAWITRAVIFFLANKKEIMFEKENWVYSDRIIPYKGDNLINQLSDPKEFNKGWEDLNLRGECKRKIVDIV